jgi:hypothetical protein
LEKKKFNIAGRFMGNCLLYPTAREHYSKIAKTNSDKFEQEGVNHGVSNCASDVAEADQGSLPLSYHVFLL